MEKETEDIENESGTEDSIHNKNPSLVNYFYNSEYNNISKINNKYQLLIVLNSSYRSILGVMF